MLLVSTNLLWAACGCCVEMWMDQTLMLHAGDHCTLSVWFPAAVGCVLFERLISPGSSFLCLWLQEPSQHDVFGGRCSQEKGNEFSLVAVVWWDKHKCRRLRLGFSSRFAADWQESKPYLWPPCQSLAQCKNQGPALGQFSCSLESTWECSICCSPVQRLLGVQFRHRSTFRVLLNTVFFTRKKKKKA